VWSLGASGRLQGEFNCYSCVFGCVFGPSAVLVDRASGLGLGDCCFGRGALRFAWPLFFIPCIGSRPADFRWLALSSLSLFSHLQRSVGYRNMDRQMSNYFCIYSWLIIIRLILSLIFDFFNFPNNYTCRKFLCFHFSSVLYCAICGDWGLSFFCLCFYFHSYRVYLATHARGR